MPQPSRTSASGMQALGRDTLAAHAGVPFSHAHPARARRDSSGKQGPNEYLYQDPLHLIQHTFFLTARTPLAPRSQAQ
jgi:hypothetical protein